MRLRRLVAASRTGARVLCAVALVQSVIATLAGCQQNLAIGELPGAGDGSIKVNDANAEAATSDDAACNVDAAWSAMLGAEIAPEISWANLNLNQNGVGLVSEAYAESVNCRLTVVSGSGTVETTAPTVSGCWGPSNDVCVGFYEANTYLAWISVSGGYRGELAFASRMGGVYGDNHVYTIGIGSITRDGVAMAIDWAGDPAGVLNELYDGFMATEFPNAPPVTDCEAAGGCQIVPGAPTNSYGANDAYFVIVPTNFYVEMPYRTTVPNRIFAVMVSAMPDGGTFDAGVPTGTTADAGPDGSFPNPGDASAGG